ncbi:hypothetical protein AAMO2058_000424700 [Amorphochlora amoebiformis]
MAGRASQGLLICCALAALALYFGVSTSSQNVGTGVVTRSMSPLVTRPTTRREGLKRENLCGRSSALSEKAQKKFDELKPEFDVNPKQTVFYQIPESVPQLGDKYAVVEVGGSQVIVEEGRWYTVNRLKANIGDVIRLPRVLLMKMAADKVQLGLPYCEDAIVEAQVVEHLRGEKLRAGKYKPKKHYRRTWGVRDELTKFVVTKIHTDSTDFIPTYDQ